MFVKAKDVLITGRNYTVFTDASHCSNTKAAGYAYWSRDNNVKHQGSIAELDVANSTTAEIRAIVWAVEDIISKVTLKGRRVIIVTDCEAAIQALTEGPKNPRKKDTQKAIRKRFKGLAEEHGFDVTFNHVKAHNNDGTPRTWVNRFCDKLCRSEMRKIRDSLL